MNGIPKKISAVGIGYSSQTDAFQRGREAAQIARNQIANQEIDFVIALGPADHLFPAFIEGVRLVTSAETLMGIPCRDAFTNGAFLPNGGLVLIVESRSLQASCAHAEAATISAQVTSTRLHSQFRMNHGNSLHQ